MAQDAGIHRVTVCSNGVRLARDEALSRGWRGSARASRCRSTPSSKHADLALQGAQLLETKLRCLDLLEKHDVDTTLIPVMTRGVNDHEIGGIIALALAPPQHPPRRGPHHHLHRPGRRQLRSRRAHLDARGAGAHRGDDERACCAPDDFVPSPCAHPLCYQIAYLLLDPDGGPPLPFTRFVPRETLYECLAERLYLEPTPRLEEALREAIDRLWADAARRRRGGARAAHPRRLLRALFPIDARRSRRAEALRVSRARGQGRLRPLAHGRGDLRRRARRPVLRLQLLRRRQHHPGVQLQRALPREGGRAS